MKAVKVIPVIRPTAKHREWLDAEKEKTGDSEASIIRRLIQKEIDSVRISK